MDDKFERYAVDFADRLFREHGLGESKIKGSGVEFTQARGSHHTKRNGIHVIMFGRADIRNIAIYGFREYKGFQWAIQKKGLVGLRGIHQLVLHEFAHVLQTEIPGGRVRGSCHNDMFERCYRELMAKYPLPMDDGISIQDMMRWEA